MGFVNGLGHFLQAVGCDLTQRIVAPGVIALVGFLERLAKLSEEMVAKHGKDFSMGALVLAARWIAENRVGQLKTN
ncbi:hypothetical protein NKH61_12650 [Mesorhizobium sp. M1005]|uniref:hypothetical protein n=1 Tax=unclassified Mesorhizobium TaxID=325217 RepID=UPI00333E1215